MVVRDADPDRDAAACAAIYAPFVEDTAVSFEEVPPTAAEMKQRISETSATHAWLVAVEGDAVVGYAYGSLHRARAAYRWTVEVAAYVAETSRGGGVGRALYEQLISRLRERGYRLACGGITLPNEASVALHRAVGFEPVGTYRRVGWKLGRWHDVQWWQLDLAPSLGDGPPPGPAGTGPRRSGGTPARRS